ncbi:hypothetical protein ACWCQS_44740 [Streptomyces sp. NPDC002076]
MTKVDTTPGTMQVSTASARQVPAGAAGEGVARLGWKRMARTGARLP